MLYYVFVSHLRFSGFQTWALQWIISEFFVVILFPLGPDDLAQPLWFKPYGLNHHERCVCWCFQQIETEKSLKEQHKKKSKWTLHFLSNEDVWHFQQL